MERTNIFDKTVEMLIEDANSLQQKFTRLQEHNDFRGAIDCMRLLKDCLALIKEYDWKLKYSEYETDGKKQIAVWEQNHCGEIKNHKTWDVEFDKNFNSDFWYNLFKSFIESNKSCLIDFGNNHRGTGKSYAITKLCDEYDGIVVYDDSYNYYNDNSCKGIKNNCNLHNLKIKFVSYKNLYFEREKDNIIFIDENSNFSSEQIEHMCEKYTVVGFM